jgi:hypothetical protein
MARPGVGEIVSGSDRQNQIVLHRFSCEGNAFNSHVSLLYWRRVLPWGIRFSFPEAGSPSTCTRLVASKDLCRLFAHHMFCTA